MDEEKNIPEQSVETAAAPTEGGDEVEHLRAELEAVRMGARPECAGDVAVLAGASGDMGKEAIGAVLAKYPHFKSLPAQGAPNPPGAAEAADPFLLGFGR